MKEQPVILTADRPALTAEISGRAWSSFDVGMVLSALFLLYALSSFVGLFFPEEQIPRVQLIVTLLIYSIIVTFISRINRQRGGSWKTSYGMGFQQMKKLWLSPVIYLACLPFMLLATKAYHLLLEQVFGLDIALQEVAQIFMQEFSGLQLFYLLMAVIVAPLFEEILFRGMVFPYLVKRGGLAGGTVMVSLLFALMHFHLPSFVPLFLLSATLCLVYWRTGTLWVSIGMHAIFNGGSILALSLMP